MRHAIIITAYHDADRLNRLIDQFTPYADKFGIFVHIDSKSPVSTDDITYGPNISTFKKYRVNWGGLNHLKSFLYLSAAALEGSYDYYHWITGQDWPVIPPECFDTVLERQPGHTYLRCTPLPGEWLPRLLYHNLYDAFDYKTPTGGTILKSLRAIQQKAGFKRKFPAGDIYRGSTYGSFTHDAMQYIVSSAASDESGWFKRCRHTFCAEEMYQHTLLANSERFRDRLSDSNLRYIDWPAEPGSGPKVLTEDDYEKIAAQDVLFMRKVDGTSEKLIGMIEERKERMRAALNCTDI